MKSFTVAAAIMVAATPLSISASDQPIEDAEAAIAEYDDERAIEILGAACEKGNQRACRAQLGMLHREYGDEAKKAARTLAEKMCTGGDAIACAMTAEYADRGHGGPKDQILQRASLISACEGGLYQACTDAAYMVADAQGGPEDKPLSRKLVNEACEKGDANSCVWAGQYSISDGWNADDEAASEALWVKARAQFTKACDQDFGEGCRNLGDLYMEGRGGERDKQAAIAVLDKACRLATVHCDKRLEAEVQRR